jgi:hypothetical protein
MDPQQRRFRWLPNEAPATGRRATLHELSGALRRSIEALMDSEIPEADLGARPDELRYVIAELVATAMHARVLATGAYDTSIGRILVVTQGGQ